MASVVVHLPGTAPWEIELERKETVLGRSPDCDIVLDDDGVSREHARLLMSGGRVVVEDLESRNGTYVNEEKVDRRALRDGDRVRFGPSVELDFAAETEEEERPQKKKRKKGSKAAASAGGGGFLFHTEWTLTPEEPGGGDGPIVLRSRVTTVGRKGSASMVLDDDSVSAMHARLDRSDAELVVSDLKSRNGTQVNDEPIVRETLEPGDIVTFGSLPFEVGRRRVFAWDRVGIAAGGLVVLVALGFGAIFFASYLDEKARVEREAARLRTEALRSIERGILASRQGDADFARSYLLNAAEMILYLNLAPPGASLSKPADIFRNIARDLPGDERGFDFEQAFQQAPVGLENLPNREYVARRVRTISVELGLDQEVPQGFVDQVWTFVDAKQTSPATFQAILNRAPRIHPQLRAGVAAAHLPEVFCYVAWQESMLIPDISSHAGARGLWQLMPFTARELGLTVNSGLDERVNIQRSTEAATKMIADLLRVIGREQFMCALASYNLGPGAVRKALTKIHDPMMPASKKYWYLVENGLIPRETSEYVARIIANMIIAEVPERFGFTRPPAWH